MFPPLQRYGTILSSSLPFEPLLCSPPRKGSDSVPDPDISLLHLLQIHHIPMTVPSTNKLRTNAMVYDVVSGWLTKAIFNMKPSIMAVVMMISNILLSSKYRNDVLARPWKWDWGMVTLGVFGLMVSVSSDCRDGDVISAWNGSRDRAEDVWGWDKESMDVVWYVRDSDNDCVFL